jgi:hypothetical protein
MRAGSAIGSGARHAVEVGLQALLIAAIIATVALAMSAVYRPAGFIAGLDSVDAGRARGTLTVPDGVFGGSTTATANPGDPGSTVYAQCFQDGERVWGKYQVVDGNHQATFQLGPTPSWTGGGATCTADELAFTKNGRWRVVASTTFDVTD